MNRMNRRTMLKTSGLATVGVMTLGVTGCGKNLSLYVATVIGSLEELELLLPNLSPQIKKAIAIAKSFDTAYRAGKFTDAATLFTNLTGVVSEIATSAGVTNPQVKLAIAVGGVALRAIAVLLAQQASNPMVASAVAASPNANAKATIERMADPVVLDKIMGLVRP